MRRYIKIVFIVSLILSVGVSSCKDEAITPVKKEVTEKVKPKKETAKPKPKAETVAKKKLEPVVEQVPNKYFLIVASFQNIGYADRLQQKLTKEGYNSEVFDAANGFHRVSYKAFSDRNSAFQELKSERASEKTKEHWLYIKR
ncbi:SPOR domain-containing protein [Labilibaculum antarcticum]|uniref:SPOR domain-containing protein n=1 Tax=Labilibaculum antarcticum TaxID=1717717 RepID=A0A1Y1CIR1_9BACT|nr:SPOR domain-containing protein [Labilibaculum antarcticum]BAX80214.1 SPOR domain-containing protein [Labilibaculum antarcticum]